ncbi:MAG: SDR family NAD(P)-dependent oxidoreductase [Gammaproteobacteria bacterium]|nr:SDR family NAD(P)-dependent oxidoreductase [Gammaproteobacteria bacterium]
MMSNHRTILVTGATSGIGAAAAEAFAGQGAVVLAVGRNAERGKALLRSLAGTGHQFIRCDLADRDQISVLLDQVRCRKGPVDGLVNCAGVVHHATVPGTDDRIWDETMAINVGAVFSLCRGLIPHMIQQGGGAIVNVASTWGLVGAERTAAYCASKGALVQLTRCMAMDHARDHVRINAVCPGAVDTPMLASEAAAFGMTVEQGRDRWSADAPNRQLASARKIAEVITFLVSEEASHIHGVALPVDGGATAGY